MKRVQVLKSSVPFWFFGSETVSIKVFESLFLFLVARKNFGVNKIKTGFTTLDPILLKFGDDPEKKIIYQN